MTKRKCLWIAAAAGMGLAASPAEAVPCSGGTLTITAASDTPLTGSAYNVGQKATLTAVATGFTPASYSWTIPGPRIKDYGEYLGTKQGPANPIAWSTTNLAAGDLSQPSVSFYWKPSAGQIHPLNGPPETRTVTLSVNGGLCTETLAVTVERNMTDINRQPEDYYTSTHRAPTETNAQLGGVIDEHMFWHINVGGGSNGSWLQFLAWHSYFLDRFERWRAEFGYPEVAPWYPGRPLPTGPDFDHPPSLRQAYNENNNRIPTYITLAGGTTVDPYVASVVKLADYANLNSFSDSFEGLFGGSYHGQIHCRIGSYNAPTINTDFVATSGPYFGSMCMSSSPKDPMFWRWHGFIDRLYRNYCTLKALTCHVPAIVASNPWMGDNAADVTAGGAVPSPGPRWMSPDIWNRTAEVTTDACLPRTTPPHLNTVGGVSRNCGSEADHENPVAGQSNFLYATLRNNSGAPQRNVYAEVAVYIANASTGLAWPTDFTMLPQSRQFVTLNSEPGQVTQIGPLPWTPPSPSPSDHWCIYIRVLSVQEAPAVEGPVVDTNVANSNSIAWRNLKIVNPGEQKMMSNFIVRNIRREAEEITLDVMIPPALMAGQRLVLTLDERLQRAAGNKPLVRGGEAVGKGRFVLTSAQASIGGLRLAPRGEGAARIQIEGATRAGQVGDIIVVQRSRAGIDGGVTLRVAHPRRQRPPR
jgi:hypothetical protein